MFQLFFQLLQFILFVFHFYVNVHDVLAFFLEFSESDDVIQHVGVSGNALLKSDEISLIYEGLGESDDGVLRAQF